MTPRAWAGVLLTLLLAGCASMIGPVENPQVSISGIRVLPPEGTEQRIEVALRIINPNSFDLKARGLVVKAGFNDITVLKGVLAEPPVVPAYGESQVNVVLSASLLDGLRLVRSIAAHPDDPLQYRLELRLDLKFPLVRRLRLLEQGEISARPPERSA